VTTPRQNFVNVASGAGLPLTPLVGSTVFCLLNHRDGVPILPGGFTDFGVVGGGPGAEACLAGYRVWQAGDSNVFNYTAAGGNVPGGCFAEFLGRYTFVAANGLDEPGASTTAFFGNGVAVGAGKTGILVGTDMGGSDGDVFTYSASGGSVLGFQKSNGTAPSFCSAYRDVVNSAATEFLLGTKDQAKNTGGVTGFFLPNAVSHDGGATVAIGKRSGGIRRWRRQ
jgi:hypothetical protein